MTGATVTDPAIPLPGLFSRIIGVITSPGATYAHIVRTPKVAGVLFVVSLVGGLAQGLPQLTERGRAATLEMQVQQMEQWGFTVDDEMYQQLEQRSRSPMSAAFTIVASFVGFPFFAVIMTVLLWGVFNSILGGTATFKHVMAVLVHSLVISTLGAAFAAPIMYARGVMGSSVANVGAFLPMLDETSFLAKFLGMIDLFLVWWLVVLAIGLAALYKRKSGGIATGLFVFYGIIIVAIAYFTSGN
jgi:hypothetical protein